MKKNLIANSINITFSILFLVAAFALQLNPLSLITAVIVTGTNMLLSIYAMGIREHPVIKIGPVSGSVSFFNIATFILQTLVVLASLSDSLWFTVICLFAVLVYLECISLFLKDLFKAMRFHITVILSVSFVTLIVYCLLHLYRDFSWKLPTLPLAIVCMGLYIFFMFREKGLFKMTAYSALFSGSVVLLALGNYASQNIYGTLLCLVGMTPVMFLLLLSAFHIEENYKEAGMQEITSVLVHFPVTGVGYLVGLLAILGFPPFSLFFSRLIILQSAVTSGNLIAVALLAIAFIASSYFLLSNTILKLFGGRKETLITIKENKFNVVIILILLIFVILLTVLTPEFIVSLISNARAYVLGVL